MTAHRFSVAPMMDWTDSACRVLHRALTRHALLYTEMVTAEAVLHGESPPESAFAGVLAGLFDQPGGDRLDTIVNACTHFPLVADRLAAAAPRPVRFVDGNAGIARRIAALTEGQAWPAVPEGRAVFTRLDDDARALAPALARFGLETVESL